MACKFYTNIFIKNTNLWPGQLQAGQLVKNKNVKDLFIRVQPTES